MLKFIKIPKGYNVQYGKPWRVNPYPPISTNYTWLINFYEEYNSYVKHIYNVVLSKNENDNPKILFKFFNCLVIKLK